MPLASRMRALAAFLYRPWRNPAADAIAHRNLSLVAEEVARLGAQRRTDDPPATAGVCRQSHFEGPAFAEWCRRLAIPPHYNRKLWEYVWICRILDGHGLLRQGSRGLGFGTGREPLAALFASRGCIVVATDLPAADQHAGQWDATGSWSADAEALANAAVCPPEVFAERVRHRAVDMRAVPADLQGFDFCWSACALEHLGTLEAGLAFVEASLRCLRPGGVAVHTTEYNLSSNDATVERGRTVLYRRRDLEGLAARLQAAGHKVAPIDWDAGSGLLDRFVDLPPYGDVAHLRQLPYDHGFVMTSVALVVRKGADRGG